MNEIGQIGSNAMVVFILLGLAIVIYSKFKNQTLGETIQEIKDIFSDTDG